jgi:hypothetical protein
MKVAKKYRILYFCLSIIILFQAIGKAQQKQSTWAKNRPTLNGNIQPGEWDEAALNKVELANSGWLIIQNDASHIYILLDLIHDNYNDPPLAQAPWGDFISLWVDVNVDGKITPNVDLSYGMYPGTYKLGVQTILGPGTTSGLPPTQNTQAILGVGFGQSMNSKIPHRIWEMSIPLAEIGASPGNSIRFGIMISSTNPGFRYYYPVYFANEFSNLLEFALSKITLQMLPPYKIKDPGKPFLNNIHPPETGGTLKRTILANGHVKIQYADGTIKEIYPGGQTITPPEGNPYTILFSSVQHDTPPSLPGDPTIISWLNVQNEFLLALIKKLVENDSFAVDFYLQNESQKAKNLYEQINLRMECIDNLLTPL